MLVGGNFLVITILYINYDDEKGLATIMAVGDAGVVMSYV